MIRRTCLTMFLAMGAAAWSVRADVVSTFDTDADGWVTVNTSNSLGNPPAITPNAPADYHATGGNPGGYVTGTDPNASWFWFSAPAKFLGDQSANYDGSLHFELLPDLVGANNFPSVVLIGNGEALYYVSSPPAGGSYTSYDIPLGTTGWKVGDYSSGPEPTASEMQDVLGDLTALLIDADWSYDFETMALDNVRLVPEPASLALLSVGGLLIARRRRDHLV